MLVHQQRCGLAGSFNEVSLKSMPRVFSLCASVLVRAILLFTRMLDGRHTAL